jgi:hypothetical protein
MEALLGFHVSFWDYVTFGAIAVIVMASRHAGHCDRERRQEASATFTQLPASAERWHNRSLRQLVCALDLRRHGDGQPKRYAHANSPHLVRIGGGASGIGYTRHRAKRAILHPRRRNGHVELHL